jgi:hypothetical protein
MICSKCKSELKEGAKVCQKCGQAVSGKPLGFPCVICGAPIPPGVEACAQCGGSVSQAPANESSLGNDIPQQKIIPEGDDTVELDAFQLDDIVIAAPPPPPPPRRTQAAAEQFEPLPNLVPRDAMEQTEFPSLGIELTPKAEVDIAPATQAEVRTPVVSVPPSVLSIPPARPVPVTPVIPASGAPKATIPVVKPAAEPPAPLPPLPPQLAPVPGVKPVRPGGQRAVVPGFVPPPTVAAPTPAVPSGVRSATPAPASPAASLPRLPAEGPLPQLAPIPELQAVMRPRVATLPPPDAGNLGPQPEDVVDEDAVRRRKAILTVAGGLSGFIVLLGVIGYLVLTKPWHHEQAAPESLQERVNKQFAENRLPPPAPLPSASPAVAPLADGAAVSAPEAAISAATAAVSAPVAPVSAPAPAPVVTQAPPVAVQPAPAPVEKPVVRREAAAKPAGKSSRRASTEEEDAYLRQIHKQLRN